MTRFGEVSLAMNVPCSPPYSYSVEHLLILCECAWKYQITVLETLVLRTWSYSVWSFLFI